jgi:hypothetical protein
MTWVEEPITHILIVSDYSYPVYLFLSPVPASQVGYIGIPRMTINVMRKSSKEDAPISPEALLKSIMEILVLILLNGKVFQLSLPHPVGPSLAISS